MAGWVEGPWRRTSSGGCQQGRVSEFDQRILIFRPVRPLNNREGMAYLHGVHQRVQPCEHSATNQPKPDFPPP